MSMAPQFQCPCCDYVSLAERSHFDICDVCFWEDDGLDVDQLDVYSGPNHMTLRAGRANFYAPLDAIGARAGGTLLDFGSHCQCPRIWSAIHFAVMQRKCCIS